MQSLVLFGVILQLVLISSAHDQCESNSCAKKCPPSWKRWRDSCYRFTPSGGSWVASREACLQMGGNLAAPQSQEENDFFWEFGKEEKSNLFWINCEKLETNNQWFCDGKAMVGSDAFEYWAPGEPKTNIGHVCTAVDIRNDGHWIDFTCSSTPPFPGICRLVPPAPRLHCCTINSEGRLDPSCFEN
ncbi:lactose-binding lectin l-2-like [Patiria miniata]|uniref:C-type lectin domain-containing protein n=1 Tax=Patiria miniata TaxID=46514 RepID=A0A914ASM4_PATMI|nr:lactose-binding lectin l-2-like [Patiria miniata]